MRVLKRELEGFDDETLAQNLVDRVKRADGESLYLGALAMTFLLWFNVFCCLGFLALSWCMLHSAGLIP